MVKKKMFTVVFTLRYNVMAKNKEEAEGNTWEKVERVKTSGLIAAEAKVYDFGTI